MAARAAAFLALACGALALRPSPPQPQLRASPTPASVPLYTPSDAPPAFSASGSPRFHNRPLYSSHNGGLVVAGDRPIVHVASDTLLFGGALLGVLDTASGQGLWAHDFASAATATYSPGAMEWSLSDARLGGGVNISARVLPLASGFGAVLDVNVSAAQPSAALQLIVAFGCGAVPGGGGALGWQYDPLLHPSVMAWDFSPEDCAGNTVRLGKPGAGGFYLSFRGAGQAQVDAAVGSAGAPATFALGNASAWRDVAAFVASSNASAPAPAPPAAAPGALPIPGAVLWLRVSALAPAADGSRVARWPDSSPSAQDLLQPSAQLQPLYAADGMGPGLAGVRFDGVNDYLANAVAALGADATLYAVLRDEGSTGGTYACCSGVVSYNGSFQGITVLAAPGATDDDALASSAAHATVAKLDYPGAGLPSTGSANIFNRTALVSALYRAGGPSELAVDGCAQATVAQGGVAAAAGVAVGTRNAELERYFKGVLAEVVVFSRALNASEQAAMQAYFAAAWPAAAPRHQCSLSAQPLAFARAPLPAGGEPLRLTLSVAADKLHSGAAAAAAAAAAAPRSSASDPLSLLSAALARAQALRTAAVVSAPHPLVGAAAAALGPAVDGLWRADPGIFVHGAMAWDVPYVGWRSEYGASVLGWGALAAAEGRLLFASQVQGSNKSACVSDASKRLTQEAPNSRFYGNGHISAFQGMYDMQSQMFDQQVHMWRWTGDAAHEAALAAPLAAHAQWAADSFDANGDGAYASYINTWPTDSQWYNGGDTVEETCYMHRAHEALRDLAARAGNATGAAAHAAQMQRIQAGLASLWMPQEGHHAASREEGGHRRLRSDAWLYSIFLPIEAGMLSAEEAAQALHYSEYALQREAVPCNGTTGAAPTCGVRVWTSNWVPSMWSVRQLWPGDNYALALAYFLAGLPDGGWEVLQGNLQIDMLQSGVPGQIGKSNGGTDFNDAVHPAARALVEGMLGYRPNYPGGVVLVSPQLPSGWGNLTMATAECSYNYSSSGDGLSTSLAVALAQPVAGRLVLQLPLRAAGLAAVHVSGLPAGATWNYTVEAGWGEGTVVVTVQGGSAAGAGVGGAVVSLQALAPLLGAAPAVTLAAGALPGARVTLAPPPGRFIHSWADPQGLLSSAALDGQGGLAGVVNASTPAPSTHAVIAYASTASDGTGVLQRVLYKIAIAAPPPAPLPPPGATFALVDVQHLYNGNLAALFLPGTYLSPRPQTCGVRIGSDGWSAWTFPYWGQYPNGGPVPQLDNVANLTVRAGVIATPQGAQFALNASGGAAFTSLWDNYPPAVTAAVPLGLLPGATSAWVLLAGSTNPMQTLLANAVLRFAFDDGSEEALELVPPRNYWALSGWAGVDYSYDTDAWCLPAVPPPTVQLGANNRAMVYQVGIPAGRQLVSVTLETLSQEVVVGLLAVSLGKYSSKCAWL